MSLTPVSFFAAVVSHSLLLLLFVLPQRLKEQRERRSESLAKKRAMRMASVASKE
jgi:hypothetical protein